MIRNNESSRSSKNIFVAFRLYVVRNIRELNLFSNNPFWSPTLNNSEQILTTRVFILFLLVSLLIVITYTSLLIRTYDVPQENFTLDDFEELQELYPTTIDAPCTQVSNPYHKFIQLSATFHPICSSPFIEDKWISSLFVRDTTYHNDLDFRTFTFAQFQAIALLCQTAKQTVEDGYRIFNYTHLVTGHVLSRAEFNEIMDVLTNNFRNNLLVNANRTAKLVSLSIAQNGLMSALRTNSFIQSAHPLGSIAVQSKNYLNKDEKTSCNCRLQENQCIYPAGVYYDSPLVESEKQTQLNSTIHFKVIKLMSNV
jgi:hypothetical protein